MSETAVPPCTLYLTGDASVMVLRDGPAIRVRKRGSADRSFPLRRLRRVLVTGQIRWETDALLACADARVPVCFIRGDGSVRARFGNGGGVRRVLDLNATLEIFLDNAINARAYHEWVEACARNERLKLVYEADRGAWPTRPPVLRRLLFERARPYARANDLRRFEQHVHALIHALVQERLEAIGVDTDLPALVVNGIDLVKDFCGILEWGVANARLGYVRREAASARRQGMRFPDLDWRAAARFVETNESRVVDRFDTLFRRLHQYMLERG